MGHFSCSHGLAAVIRNISKWFRTAGNSLFMSREVYCVVGPSRISTNRSEEAARGRGGEGRGRPVNLARRAGISDVSVFVLGPLVKEHFLL